MKAACHQSLSGTITCEFLPVTVTVWFSNLVISVSRSQAKFPFKDSSMSPLFICIFYTVYGTLQQSYMFKWYYYSYWKLNSKMNLSKATDSVVIISILWCIAAYFGLKWLVSLDLQFLSNNAPHCSLQSRKNGKILRAVFKKSSKNIIFTLITDYLRGRNFRGKKILQISRILAKFAKINSFFDPRKCRFAKINSREIFPNWWFAKINSREIFQELMKG